MTTRAAVCVGLNEPWKTEEIEIDPPGNREVRVKMVWSGMCHSDEHLRSGDISQTPEVLEMMGVKSMFPVVGGHEGSGIVTEVGTNVTQVAEGDHVAVSFIPSCGTCHWCASGRQNLCDLGMMTLAGGMISDGTYRYHLAGEDLNRMAQLGTFADEMVVHENSLVKINPWENMKAAALISCGIATGFGSAVDRGKVKPGETVDISHYRLTFDGVFNRPGPNYRDVVGHFTVRRASGDVIGAMEPSRRTFPARNMATTEAALMSRGFSQLYLSLGDPNPDGTVPVRLFFKPHVLMIWFGAIIMFFGGALSLSDRRLRVGAPRPAKAKAKDKPALQAAE